MGVGQICPDCARTEYILLLAGEGAREARNGGSAAAEINPAGGVYFSEERQHIAKEKGMDFLGE